jgi:hypothetical protein
MNERNSRPHAVFTFAAALALSAGLSFGQAGQARADETPAPAPPSKHQLMKDCMAKQKASEAGRSKEDMKKSCRDVTKTEKQNADRAEKTSAQ